MPLWGKEEKRRKEKKKASQQQRHRTAMKVQFKKKEHSQIRKDSSIYQKPIILIDKFNQNNSHFSRSSGVATIVQC